MAVRAFQQSPSDNLSALYDFLNTYKEGTFLENATLTLTESQDGIENGKIIFSDGSAELFISTCANSSTTQIIGYTGEYIKSTMDNYKGTNKHGIKYDSALLCSKGLILSFSASGGLAKQIDRVIITVDNADKLVLVMPNTSAYSFETANHECAVTTYDSTVITPINASPVYGANKTSMAPVALIALSTDRYLPYVYVAVTTQLAAEGLQTVLIDGAPFITNGIWYIQDPE